MRGACLQGRERRENIMVDIIKEYPFLTGLVSIMVMLFMVILNTINYRKKKYYKSVLTTLIGDDEEVFELYNEAIKLEKQDIKVAKIEPGEKGQVSAALKQIKARDTAAKRKKDNDLRKQEKRLESIVKLANINRSQILDDLAKNK